MPKNGIALVVFSLSIEEELKRKPFLATKNLAKSLRSHLSNITKNCGLPVFHYDEQRQFGSDFGSRFSNALQDVCKKGYHAIIAIGGDVPHLEARHILLAKEELLKGNTVVGPTFDGGFYLLGILSNDFDHSTFQGFSWNSQTVYEELLQTLSARNRSTVTLQKLRDVDHFSDIGKLDLRYLRTSSLRQLIQDIRSLGQDDFKNLHLGNFRLLTAVPFNKGSPSTFPFS
ncbi:DUF2064 domain-containing protein [Muricauda sp. JGD-17]|uniref:DUF2064 domain-containing protein n=1 Tax=Flagellimonas ochracea TaxID=2696472 RepID=A0A964TFE9_9FLAO|nr:DUF2064 domain-containing protein [Allomuricauda ochracea]NAY93396.1 DUF2064 domain-containing protein [Allomuricauda ochracea]